MDRVYNQDKTQTMFNDYQQIENNTDKKNNSKNQPSMHKIPFDRYKKRTTPQSTFNPELAISTASQKSTV